VCGKTQIGSNGWMNKLRRCHKKFEPTLQVLKLEDEKTRDNTYIWS